MTDYVLTVDFFDQIVERRPDRSALRIVKHRRGDTVTGLTDAEVERLTAAGAIRPVVEKSAEPTDAEPDLVIDENPDGDGSDDEKAGDAAVERPLKTASAADWRKYAESKGLSKDESADLTRAELISRYGSN